MNIAITILLLIVGIIHLLPLAGVLGAAKLQTLYALPIESADLAILMRHRAVLFGLLGAFLVYAAFKPALQGIALIAGGVSVASFLWLALSTGGYNAAIQKVVVADWIAAGCLIVAAVLYGIRHST